MDIKNPPLIIPEVGFRVELGGRPTNRAIVLEQQEKHSLYYRDHFYNKGKVIIDQKKWQKFLLSSLFVAFDQRDRNLVVPKIITTTHRIITLCV